MSEAQPGVWFCELCGEAVFSIGKPSRCPACGAWPQLMVEPMETPRVLARGQQWSPAILEGGRSLIVQEMDTSELYSRVSASSDHPLLRSTFRALQRIEGRHATLLCAVFRTKRPGPTLRPDLTALSDLERLEMVRPREDETIGLYRAQIELCRGTELETVYQALMDIEEDHNALSDRLMALLGRG